MQGDCGEAYSDSVELLSGGTLLYISKGDGKREGFYSAQVDCEGKSLSDWAHAALVWD